MAELQLDPKKTALVLIDLQNAVVGMNPVPHTAAQVVENSRKLAEAFRAHSAPVVYVRVDLNDFMKLPVDQPHNLGDKPLPAAASEIAPSAGFQPGDILVTKRHWAPSPAPSWSSSSNPAALTRSSSPVSPPTQASSPQPPGRRPRLCLLLVEDACSSQNAEHHRFAFENIFPRLARVRTTDEVLASLA